MSSGLSDLQNSARTVRSLLVIRGRGVEELGEVGSDGDDGEPVSERRA